MGQELGCPLGRSQLNLCTEQGIPLPPLPSLSFPRNREVVLWLEQSLATSELDALPRPPQSPGVKSPEIGDKARPFSGL